MALSNQVLVVIEYFCRDKGVDWSLSMLVNRRREIQDLHKGTSKFLQMPYKKPLSPVATEPRLLNTSNP